MKRDRANGFKVEFKKLWIVLVQNQQFNKTAFDPTKFLLECFFIRFLELKIDAESSDDFSHQKVNAIIERFPVFQDFILAKKIVLDTWGESITAFFKKFQWKLEYSNDSECLTPQILEWIAEQSAEKNHVGTVYTPKSITDNIVHTTIMSYLMANINRSAQTHYQDIYTELIASNQNSNIESTTHNSTQEKSIQYELLVKLLKFIRICDNASGGGNFLVSIWHCVLNIYRNLAEKGIILTDDRIEEKPFNIEAYLFRIGRYILESNIYGVDINPNAIFASKLRLWLELIKIYPSSNLSMPKTLFPDLAQHLVVGNTLIGMANPNRKYPHSETNPMAFHWIHHFPEVFKAGGFHVIVGNPPYGQNNLTLQDRKMIHQFWQPISLGKKSEGKTYNSAALFIERSYQLLQKNGWLGYIVNNSIARVDEFNAIRDYLFSHGILNQIIDEGNPFKEADVTLEMISIFVEKQDLDEYDVTILNRRVNPPRFTKVPITLWRAYSRIVLYADDIFTAIYQNSRLNVLHGTRGRDVEKRPVRNAIYNIPYLFSGKSIKKFRIDEAEIEFASRKTLEKETWKREYMADTMLVATKINNKYRISLKPVEVLVGNNVIKITAQDIPFNPYVIMAILNSKLMDYIVYRYILNYSDLTTAFYDSITLFTPIILPQYETVFEKLAQILIYTATKKELNIYDQYMYVLNALVFELFFAFQIYGKQVNPLQKHLDLMFIPFDFQLWWNNYWKVHIQEKPLEKDTKRLQKMEMQILENSKLTAKKIRDNREITEVIHSIYANPWVKSITEQQKDHS